MVFIEIIIVYILEEYNVFLNSIFNFYIFLKQDFLNKDEYGR